MFECALCLASAPFAPIVFPVLPRAFVSPLLARSLLFLPPAIVNPFASSSPYPRHLHARAPREDAYYQRANRCVALAVRCSSYRCARVARQMRASCTSLRSGSILSLLAPELFVPHGSVCYFRIIKCTNSKCTLKGLIKSDIKTSKFS